MLIENAISLSLSRGELSFQLITVLYPIEHDEIHDRSQPRLNYPSHSFFHTRCENLERKVTFKHTSNCKSHCSLFTRTVSRRS